MLLLLLGLGTGRFKPLVKGCASDGFFDEGRPTGRELPPSDEC